MRKYLNTLVPQNVINLEFCGFPFAECKNQVREGSVTTKSPFYCFCVTSDNYGFPFICFYIVLLLWHISWRVIWLNKLPSCSSLPDAFTSSLLINVSKANNVTMCLAHCPKYGIYLVFPNSWGHILLEDGAHPVRTRNRLCLDKGFLVACV